MPQRNQILFGYNNKSNDSLQINFDKSAFLHFKMQNNFISEIYQFLLHNH